jgi:hypothetical protein
MTQAGYRHRVIIQDRSGSMEKILAGAQEGLDEFLQGEAAAPGKVTVSLWDFDTETRCVASFRPPGEVAGYLIVPRGGTNLYDAVAMAVTIEGAKLGALPEDQRPEDVTVLVASDGAHNTTVEHDGPQVRDMLGHQQAAYGWRVIYMGCNQDAFAEGAKIGARAGLTVNSVGTSTGQHNAWRMSLDYLSRVPVAAAAAARGQSADLTDEERSLGESGEEQE